MKARPVKLNGYGYEECPIEEATHVEIHIVGPSEIRHIPIILKGDRKDTGCWTWNGDIEKPTLKPSILTKSGHFDENNKGKGCWCDYNKEHPEDPAPFTCFLCHTWINEGRVIFLDDCSHEFKGQILDLLDV